MHSKIKKIKKNNFEFSKFEKLIYFEFIFFALISTSIRIETLSRKLKIIMHITNHNITRYYFYIDINALIQLQ